MELEVKYAFPNVNATVIKRLLEIKFQRDPSYPAGVITSIYFDDANMQSYYEKRASTYRKTKVRLRWYCTVGSGEPMGDAFWEVKDRFGNQRSKQRVVASMNAQELDAMDLHDGRLLKSLKEECCIDSEQGQFLPSVAIRYTRHRFIDPVNGSRVNVDSNIFARSVNKCLANETSKQLLPLGVLEYKGKYDRIPPYLSEIGALGARKQAFSKYESAIKWVKSNHQLC